MLRDIIIDYIEKYNCVVTSSPGNGTSSLILFLTNLLTESESNIIFYNPDRSIDRTFVKRFYPNVFNKVMIIESPVEIFIEFLSYIDYKVDRLIIDPADVLLGSSKILQGLMPILKANKIKVLCSSQIRTDVANGGKTYSTLEKTGLFDYSIWIRNVSESNGIFIKKYVDVWKHKRNGNNFASRYIAKFGKEGNVLNA